MKKTVFLFFLFYSLAFSQSKKADAILTEISNVTSDSIRCRLTLELLLHTSELTQQDKIYYSKKIQRIAREKDDCALESIITSSLAYLFLSNGNSLQATELCYRALEIAEKKGSNLAKGFAYNVLALCESKNDTEIYRNYLFKSLKYCAKANDNTIVDAVYKNLSDSYFSEKYKDSALYYAQKALQQSKKSKNEYIQNYSLISLGNIHYYLMKDKAIGYAYMRKVLNTKYTKVNAEANLYANLAIATLHINEKNLDSALFYTNKGFVKKNKIPLTSVAHVYSTYKKIYVKKNSDSAIKYYQLHDKVKDSIRKMSNVEEQQLFSINKGIEIENKAQQRKLNIQYAIIGISILLLCTLYLLLSRSFITSPKTIKFFGIVGLLTVFEFINLLIHPFLENITHHNAILMLLALVAIAALLVPLHHKVEHWATHKMIEKNREIRLAIAKKTIENLEEKS